MDWHELQKMKVDDLRALGKEKAGLDAASGLHKEELVEKIAAALGIPKPHPVVEGASFDKAAVKKKIRAVKAGVKTALAAKDRKAIKLGRKRVRRLKRKIRRAAQLTH